MDGSTVRTIARWLFALACLGGLILASLFWMTALPLRSHQGPLPALSASQAQLAGRLEAHVRTIGSRPRNVNNPMEFEQAARYLETTLSSMGYAVRSLPYEARAHRVRNIEVVVDPVRAAAPTLVIGAHYDSAGHAPGANDNGTGVAALLELARSLAPLGGKSACRIRLVLFANEEPPFFKRRDMGSLVYAHALARSGEHVAGMISLETLGYYSDRPGSQKYPWPFTAFYPSQGDFVAFVGTLGSRSFVRRTARLFRQHAAFPSEGGVAPGFIPGITFSDHWSFDEIGVPAVMITDTAPFRYPHYHLSSDTPDKVDYSSLARIVSGLEPVVRGCAGIG